MKKLVILLAFMFLATTVSAETVTQTPDWQLSPSLQLPLAWQGHVSVPSGQAASLGLVALLHPPARAQTSAPDTKAATASKLFILPSSAAHTTAGRCYRRRAQSATATPLVANAVLAARAPPLPARSRTHQPARSRHPWECGKIPSLAKNVARAKGRRYTHFAF